MANLEGALLRAKEVSKRYGGVRALDGVSLAVLPGEVHALVGENGAGKSTLVKILAGSVPPDEGSVEIDGKLMSPLTPKRARRAGIAVVYQELSLVPQLTVLENMFLGTEMARVPGVLAGKEMRSKARQALDRVGGEFSLEREARELRVAERQLVEIARALVHEARVVLFDEPSAILSGAELDRVFGLIRELRSDGMAVLYISHRLSEIFDLADRATVLRDGQVVGTHLVADLDMTRLIDMMVGRRIERRGRVRKGSGSVVLEVRDLALRQGAANVSFKLHAGEVLGLAGLVGSGRSRLANALAGVVPVKSGTLLLDEIPIRIRSPKDAVVNGISMIPEDRKGAGLLLDQSVRTNIGLASLDSLGRAGFIRRGRERLLARRTVERFDIRPKNIELATGRLSGGNQQKVVLGKWLMRTPAPRVVILDEPTRGVDVGAKDQIHRLIDEMAALGAAVLLISSELPELIENSDRIIVMRSGELVACVDQVDFREEYILSLAVLGRDTVQGAEPIRN
jgi:ABC-type sugar transport system ATPase subunit